jgi:hypothetical protein
VCRGGSWSLRSFLVHGNNNTYHNGDDDDNDNADEKAPPLLATSAARFCDGSADLCVRLDDVLVNLLALLLDILDKRLLLHDNLIKVLEELCELDHLLLNLLNGFVALLDIAEGR